tara:strand:- start:571 stop:741 length:171 start_codon:yes stop_codon:yes gene_type:complete
MLGMQCDSATLSLEKAITARAVILGLTPTEETLGVTLTHGDRFSLPNGARLVEYGF